VEIHKFKLNDIKLLLDVNSGALHIIDDTVWDILDLPCDPLSHKVLDHLRSSYSVQDIKEAQNELSVLKREGLLFTPPQEFPSLETPSFLPVKALCLHISHDCNLRCRYCFAKTGSFGGERSHMPVKVAEDAMNFLAHHSGDRRNLEVDFFGGEPLLNFQAVKGAVKRAKEIEEKMDKKFRFTLTTNSLLLDEEIEDLLNEQNISLILSLDGPQEINDAMRIYPDGRGTYSDILPKIIHIMEKRDWKNYYIRGTYTAESLDFSRIVLYLADLGFQNISLEPVVVLNREYSIEEKHIPFLEKEYDKLAETYMERVRKGKGFNFYHFNLAIFHGPCLLRRLKACGAGTEYMALTPEGELYACHQLVNNRDFFMGDIYNGIRNEDLRRIFYETTIFHKKDCPQCWARFFCSGGCYASAYLMNKDITLPDKTGCALQKKRIECALAIQAIFKKENILWKQSFL